MCSCNIKPYLGEQKPLRELGRLCLSAGEQSNEVVTEVRAEPRGGLPLLQVWPSDSPRGEADGQAQAFVFPDVQENVNDSGIESIQVRNDLRTFVYLNHFAFINDVDGFHDFNFKVSSWQIRKFETVEI